ncbi:MAG TPA: hypothetical protein GXX38_09170 [Clostridia bacterium]|nr:hypothetical protein [Clostridia bacterium]
MVRRKFWQGLLLGGVVGSGLAYLSMRNKRIDNGWARNEAKNLIKKANELGDNLSKSVFTKRRKKYMIKQMNLNKKRIKKFGGEKMLQIGDKLIRLGKRVKE